MSATRKNDSVTQQTVLHMALELSEKTWKLAFTTGLGQEPRQRDIPAKAAMILEKEILAAKERFGLPPETLVVSCYEAGRDGFWLHRCLLSLGVDTSTEEGEGRGGPLHGGLRTLIPSRESCRCTHFSSPAAMSHHTAASRLFPFFRSPVVGSDEPPPGLVLEDIGAEG
jgi:hypothetical protein